MNGIVVAGSDLSVRRAGENFRPPRTCEMMIITAVRPAPANEEHEVILEP